jgi:hypothetical protein
VIDTLAANSALRPISMLHPEVMRAPGLITV